jgi:hypothetical protein
VDRVKKVVLLEFLQAVFTALGQGLRPQTCGPATQKGWRSRVARYNNRQDVTETPAARCGVNFPGERAGCIFLVKGEPTGLRAALFGHVFHF